MKNFRYRHLKSKKVKTLPDDYERRNQHLKELGFSSYAEYLESPLWKQIRDAVLERDNSTCVICPQRATEVHHNSYELDVLSGVNTVQLVSLCRMHHKKIEFEASKENTLLEARKKLEQEGLKLPPLVKAETDHPKDDFVPRMDTVDGEFSEVEKLKFRRQRIDEALAFTRRLENEGVLKGSSIREKALDRQKKKKERKALKKLKRKKE